MDVKVITRHYPSNYGSLLQALATEKIVKKLDNDCQIVDYQRHDEIGIAFVLNSLKQKKKFNNLIKKIIYVVLRYPSEKLAELKFNRMRTQYLSLTRRISTVAELKKLKADVFMTGSDQVWGPMVNGLYDSVYFLTFVSPKATKVAYAASFGHVNFSDSTYLEYKNFLSSYDFITVRERSAVDIINNLGVRCDGQVLDPTLLLTSLDWSELIKEEKDENYVLVYQIHNDPSLGKYAKQFAEKANLPLRRVSASLHQIFREGHFSYLPNVSHFLSLIKNCKYLITDSFHGTAFAINFNVQFIEVLPDNKTESRNLSLLELVKLKDRVLQSNDDFSFIDNYIDFLPVNETIDNERQKSIQIMKNFFI